MWRQNVPPTLWYRYPLTYTRSVTTENTNVKTKKAAEVDRSLKSLGGVGWGGKAGLRSMLDKLAHVINS
jgi:hypothetical protein